MSQRRYGMYHRPRLWRRLASPLRSRLRRSTRAADDAWRGDPDTIRLVHEHHGWVLRWAEPSHDSPRRYGHAGLDGLLGWARSKHGNRIEVVAVRVDPDLTLQGANVTTRDEPTPRTWVEIVCSDPALLLGAAHEFFGPGGWVEQPGGDPTFVTR
jgi:hypothetical protein